MLASAGELVRNADANSQAPPQIEQKLWGRGPANCVLPSYPYASDALSV